MKAGLPILLFLAILPCSADESRQVVHERRELVHYVHFDHLSFKDDEIVTVLEFVRLKTYKEANWRPDEIAFEYRFAPTKSSQKISLELRGVSLWQALKQICEKAGLDVEIRDGTQPYGRITFTDAKKPK